MYIILYAGTVKGPQPNTYDVAMYGVNTFIGSLYLCALRSIHYTLPCLSNIVYFRAAEEMAKLKGDQVCQLTILVTYVKFRTQQISTVTGSH